MAWSSFIAIVGAVGLLIAIKWRLANNQRRPTSPSSTSAAGAAAAKAAGGKLAGAKVVIFSDCVVSPASSAATSDNTTLDSTDETAAAIATLQLVQQQCRELILVGSGLTSEEDPAFLRLLKIARAAGIPRRRVLAASSEKGTEAICRQMSPQIVVLRNSGLGNFLAQFIETIVILPGGPTVNNYQTSAPVKVNTVRRLNSLQDAVSELIA